MSASASASDSGAGAGGASSGDAPSCRLPAHTKPSHYVVRLKPDLETFKFTGTTSVNVTVDASAGSVATLQCNAKDLNITSINVGGKPAKSWDINTDVEILTITLDEAVSGDTTVEFVFDGELKDNMCGFYRSTYTNAAGEKKVMASTQFESTDARRAFPCWDEPAFKATFDVILDVAEKYVALSNMPVTSSVASDTAGNKVVSYATSPIMSTYLVAFVVGELEKVSGATSEGVEVNVFTTPGKKEQGIFALDMAIHTLTFFSTYFAIKYPLPKADLVAIPDFAAGAMENWGLITFRETALLVAEGKTSATIRQRVAYVVGHELAHQWFGNLVTMEWWSDLWLNEGFATWAGWLAVADKFPDWGVWENFTSTEAARALSTDSLLSSHPIEVPIDDPKEIDQIFDALSYQKGSCVIRMIEAFLGAAKFREGMQLYLQRHKYSNARTSDLWAALGEASGAPVASIMDTWTRFIGYPVVTVSETGAVEQQRFLTTGKPTEEQNAHIWSIPLTAFTASGEKISAVVSERTSSDALAAAVSSGGLFKANLSQTGFYRVNYTAAQWEALGKSVMTLDATDRVGLLSDAFALSKAGLLSPAQVLSLYANCKSETSLAVWTQMISDIGAFSGLLENEPQFATFQRYLADLYAPVVAHVGWDARESDGHQGAMLRTLILKAASGVEGSPLIEEGMRRFRALRADPTSVHPDLHDVVMNMAISNGGVEAFDSVMDMYKENEGHSETRVKCLVALGRAREPALITRFLEWSITSDEVRNQDLLYALMSLAANRHARRMALDYVRKQWDLLMSKYRSTGMLLNYIATIPLRGFSDTKDAEDAEAFFKANPLPEASMGIARALEDIRGAAAWLSRDGAAIGSFLEDWAAKA